jgi:hypothetical protein
LWPIFGGFGLPAGGGFVAGGTTVITQPATTNVVVTASPAAERPVITNVRPVAGTTNIAQIDGTGFGNDAGQVALDLGAVRLTLRVTAWSGSAVQVELPSVQLTSAVSRRVTLVRADGATSQAFDLATASQVAAN